MPLALALAFLPAPQTSLANPAAPRLPGTLLVSGFNSNQVHEYRARDGAPRGSVPVPGAQSIVRGPDGWLYVCAEKQDRVVRFDPVAPQTTLETFVGDDPLTPQDENGSLDGPTAAVFGPDGALYVTSFETDEILRFDGRTGAYRGVFIAAGASPLDGPDAGTKFGADGLLYVPSFWNDRVLRYDLHGQLVDEFIPFRRGNLREPRDLVQHDGDWFVASSFNDRILRFDSQGNYVGIFATVGQPYCLVFHPLDGNLYVANARNDVVREFDGETGLAIASLVPSASAGLDGAVFLFFLE